MASNLKIVRGEETWNNYQRKSEIHECACERRYIKSREGQEKCLFCTWEDQENSLRTLDKAN